MTEIVLIVGAVALVIGFASGWRVNEWRESAAKVAAIEKAQALQAAEAKRADDISQKFERKLAGFRVTQKTFFNEVRNETIQRVYSDCVVPESGRLLLGRAAADANAAAGQPNQAVPGAAAGAAAADHGGSADVGGGGGRNVSGVRWPAWLTGGTGQ